jgi:hypothetical protein
MDTINQYRFFSTPRTLLIGADGRVQQAWNGLLTDDTLALARRLLSSPQ